MDYRDLFDRDRELCRERYELARERIDALAQGEISRILPEDWRAYFYKMAVFIRMTADFYQACEEGENEEAAPDIEALRIWNQKLYDCAGQIVLEHMNGTTERLLYLLKEEIQGMICFAFEHRIMEMTILMELYIQVYCQIEAIGQEILERWGAVTSERHTFESEEPLHETIYYYVSDYADLLLDRRIGELSDPSWSFVRDLIMNTGYAADAGHADNLYLFGEPVGPDSLRLAKCAGAMSDDAVEKLADTWLRACREKLHRCGGEGSERDECCAGKDREGHDHYTGSGKGTVRICYPMGLERVVGLLIRKLEEDGYAVICCRPPVSLIAKDWDKPGEIAGPELLLDNALKERRLSVMRKAVQDRRSQIDALTCTLVLRAGSDVSSEGAYSEEGSGSLGNDVYSAAGSEAASECTDCASGEGSSAGSTGKAKSGMENTGWKKPGRENSGKDSGSENIPGSKLTPRQSKLLEKMVEEERRIIPGGLSPYEDPDALIISFSPNQIG